MNNKNLILKGNILFKTRIWNCEPQGSWPWCKDYDQRGTNEPSRWWPQRPLQVVLVLQEKLKCPGVKRGHVGSKGNKASNISVLFPSTRSCNQNTDRAAPCWGSCPPSCLRTGHVQSWAHRSLECCQTYSDGTMFAKQYVLKGKNQGKILLFKKHTWNTLINKEIKDWKK